MSYSYKLEPVSLKEERKQKYDIYSFFVLKYIHAHLILIFTTTFLTFEFSSVLTQGR
jgi:hypothetical protein